MLPVIAGLLKVVGATLVDKVADIAKSKLSDDEKTTQVNELVTKEFNELQSKLIDASIENDKQVTERLKADMNSTSSLSKNIRPSILIILTFANIAAIFLNHNIIFDVLVTITDAQFAALQTAWMMCMAFYFGLKNDSKGMK